MQVNPKATFDVSKAVSPNVQLLVDQQLREADPEQKEHLHESKKSASLAYEIITAETLPDQGLLEVVNEEKPNIAIGSTLSPLAPE